MSAWHGSINLNIFKLILSNLQNANVNLCQTKKVFVSFYYEGLNVSFIGTLENTIATSQ